MRSAVVSHTGPSSSLVSYAVGRGYLALAGWRIEGELPDSSKGILIAAPHTSGWDLPYMLATAWVFRLKLNWLGKHTLFEGWRGGFMSFLGGLPVNRGARHGVVGQVADRFRESDALWLAIAPAGTRSKRDHWKSGFYHIAREARVPIICGFLDYKRKVAGVGPSFVPTGNIKADMDRIRAFYRDIGARKPESDTLVRLLEEDARDLYAEA
jgi:1-acyl-sn-glycerol-3-phosphate acyltransferase